MIAFDLQCENGHIFEGWFADNQAYTIQKKKGLILCPACNTTSVSKIPSTFAIKGSQDQPAPKKKMVDMKKMTHEVVDYVYNTFDNVGSDFAKEALKIHYGVTEPRNIRGVSTEKEEKTLKEEGVQFFKIPIPAQVDSDTDTDTEN